MDNEQLSEHFSFDELTVTLNEALQSVNRDVTPEQLAKLKQLAQNADSLQGCETVRALCGGGSMRVHSGYRSEALNGATHGASKTSQHMLCEAVDFDVPGQSIDATFATLLAAAQAGKLRFGELIIEQADRGYKNEDGTESIARWVHYSVIGTLAPEKVGEAMRMTAGPDGKCHYELVQKFDFSAAA